MSTPLDQQLKRIFRAVVIHSQTSFSFAGKLSSPLQAAAAMPPPGTASLQHPLLAPLQQMLYQYCYTQTFTGTITENAALPAPEDYFLQELSTANAGRDYWDGGWQIQQILPTGQIISHKHGLIRTLWPGEFVSHSGPGVAPLVGASISIYRAKESKVLQPGFYFAFGEATTDQLDESNLIRFYWNVKDTDVGQLMLALFRELNRFRIPYRFKCPNSRALYNRVDTAVLYINKRYFRITAELLAGIHTQLTQHLRPDVPLFTKKLAHGLGLAEDPANGESFGMHRSRLLAEAIWNVYLTGEQSETARMEEVVKHFERQGLTLERPYLNPRSQDQYEFPLQSA